MRKLGIVGLMLTAAFASPAFAQSFVGQWTATAHVGTAEVVEKVSVTKAGDGYSITAEPSTGAPPGSPQAGPGTDIVLDGNNFSYRRSLDAPGSPITIIYTGVVSGDTFIGTAKVGDSAIPYTGVRVGTAK